MWNKSNLRFSKLIVLAVLSCFFLEANADAYWQIIAEKSSLSFVYRQMGVPVEGAFKRFTSQIAFDPQKPFEARARFDIDLASIDTGASDADEEVRGKLWFNTKMFPQARFVSTAIDAMGSNVFDVSGKLTIKGKTLDMHTPVSFRQDGRNGVFEGVFVIKRADFAIGEGIWADFSAVANAVQIKFRLVAASTVSLVKK